MKTADLQCCAAAAYRDVLERVPRADVEAIEGLADVNGASGRHESPRCPIHVLPPDGDPQRERCILNEGHPGGCLYRNRARVGLSSDQIATAESTGCFTTRRGEGL